MEYIYSLNGINVLVSGWAGKVKAVYKITYKDKIRYDIDVELTQKEIENIVNNGKCYEMDYEEEQNNFMEMIGIG